MGGTGFGADALQPQDPELKKTTAQLYTHQSFKAKDRTSSTTLKLTAPSGEVRTLYHPVHLHPQLSSDIVKNTAKLDEPSSLTASGWLPSCLNTLKTPNPSTPIVRVVSAPHGRKQRTSSQAFFAAGWTLYASRVPWASGVGTWRWCSRPG